MQSLIVPLVLVSSCERNVDVDDCNESIVHKCYPFPFSNYDSIFSSPWTSWQALVIGIDLRGVY